MEAPIYREIAAGVGSNATVKRRAGVNSAHRCKINLLPSSSKLGACTSAVSIQSFAQCPPAPQLASVSAEESY
jgi:hypothetical protein